MPRLTSFVVPKLSWARSCRRKPTGLGSDMIKRKFVSLVLLLSGAVFGEVKVEVAGLRVVGKAYQEEGSEDELRAFNWTEGTNIALLVSSDEKAIVSFDQDESKIVSFGDDKGTDFLKAKNRFSSRPYSFGMADFSESKMTMMTEIESPGVPAKGAMTLAVKGELKVSVASKSSLKKSAKVALKKGEKIEVGDVTLTLGKVGKPDWGDDPLEVSLKGSVDLKNFREVIFYGEDGKEIESKRGSWSSMGMFGKKTYEVSYQLKKKTSQIVLGLEVWTDLEVVTVPLDLKVGAGL